MAHLESALGGIEVPDRDRVGGGTRDELRRRRRHRDAAEGSGRSWHVEPLGVAVDAEVPDLHGVVDVLSGDHAGSIGREGDAADPTTQVLAAKRDELAWT